MSELIDIFVESLPGNPEAKDRYSRQFSPSQTTHMRPEDIVALKLETVREILTEHYYDVKESRQIASKWTHLNNLIKSN